MRKLYKVTTLLMLIVALSASRANAQGSFYVNNNKTDLEPGTDDTIEIMLDNSSQYYGFQAQLTLPAGLELKGGPGLIGADASYQLITNVKNGVIHMAAFSSQPDTSASGVGIKIDVTVSPTYKGGNLSLKNIILTASGDKDETCDPQDIIFGVLPISIALDRRSVGLEPSDKVTLTATINPEYATKKALIWETSNPDVAKVDENGTVTAVYRGSATITATTVNGKKATCIVLVEIPVTSVEIDPTWITLKVGDKTSLTAIVKPDDADNSEFINWHSSDETVATVDEKGNLTALKIGETIITADCGNQSASCTVTVIPTPAESVTVSPTSAELNVGETTLLTATIIPDDVTDKTVTWSSSDPTKVTVDAYGMVTGVALGQATITATCGTVSGICTVTVIPTPAGSVTVSPATASLKAGETVMLTATILPEDTTDKTVVWSSSDETIATVAADGTVTAVAVGEATITATCGTVNATSTITVVPTLAEKVTVSPETARINVGETKALAATVMPATTTDKTVTWSSSDEKIATVDENGVVTGVSVGNVTITATCGSLSATCAVEITAVLAESITLSTESAEIKIGETTTLTATVRPENTTDKTVTWSSDNETIATVDGNGVVTGLAVGEVLITATCASVSAKCHVTVNPILAESIEMAESVEMRIGEAVTLTATVLPENTTDKSLTWTSSDETIATVDANGMITAVALGATEIKATTANGKSGVCTVTVIPIPVTGISLTNTVLYLKVGNISEQTAIIEPADATNKSVVWNSADESIASVDNDGYITANAVGTTIVTCSSVDNPAIKAECRVIVETDFINVTNIFISRSTLDLIEDDTYLLTATVTPDNATYKTLTWASSDTSIATVSDNGLVTAVAPGTAMVYASTSNGLTAECTVTVTAKIIEVSGISLSNYELLMREGHTAELIAVVSPEDATDKTVTWKSEDESIATVDNNGIVTAIKTGVVNINATTVNGLSATCVVTVVPVVVAVKEITLNRTELELTEDDNFTLIATIKPDDATDKTVTWKSSNRTVAVVSENGVVTALTAGEAVIYASSSNGLTAECNLTVLPKLVAPTGISLSNTELLMRVGRTAELLAIVHPDNATDKTVVWSSEDETVADVDNNGIVTAVRTGTVKVIATTVNGISAICTVTVVEDTKAVEDISLNKTELTLTEGDLFTLIATITPDDATDKTVTWRSSNLAIAVVSENGVVTAMGAGDAVIYASSSNGLTAECKLTVLPKLILPTGISLSNTELLMREGHTAEIYAIVHPDNATDKTVIWGTGDGSIAKVDNNGLITAVSLGNVNITATTVNGLTATCAVTVVPVVVAVKEITLNRTELELTEHETFTLIATVKPDDATDKTITWLSSNEAIASVSDAGVVTAIAAGTAVIYASSSNGLTAECSVTVYPKFIEVTSIDLNTYFLTLVENETAPLKAIILPEDATDKTVTWSTNNPEIAIVDNDGIVTALKTGTATITAKSSNGKNAYCAVEVIAQALTPRQLLKKGDGTTCTFVVMMGLPDAELSKLGYKYAFGYTAPDGSSRIIAETSLRYCHTTPEIFNDPTLDFWVFAFYENEDGEVVTSNLRHLDGREELCKDPSVYGFSFKGHGVRGGDYEDWITLTPTDLIISVSDANDQRLGIYTMDGVLVYSRLYGDTTGFTDVIELTRFSPGIYLVIMNCDGEVKAKKISIR